MSKKKFLSIAVLILSCSSLITAGDKALSLKKSTPAESDISIAVDSQIILEFSNNVVNRTVQEINGSCFLLKDDKGSSVELEVQFPDDQMEPELKRTIIIKPVEILKNEMKYTLEIDGGLQSKNGKLLGRNITLSFTTAN